MDMGMAGHGMARHGSGILFTHLACSHGVSTACLFPHDVLRYVVGSSQDSTAICGIAVTKRGIPLTRM
jgi:hypothetical protein